MITRSHTPGGALTPRTIGVPRISVDGVTKRFRSTVAVDGLSLTADAGVVGLLGPNGAGKTTLLRMLATVLAPDSGGVQLFGLDPSQRGERLQAQVRGAGDEQVGDSPATTTPAGRAPSQARRRYASSRKYLPRFVLHLPLAGRVEW